MNNTTNQDGGNRISDSRRQVLPVVQRMRTQIDEIFLRYVGPIGAELGQEAFPVWVKTGNTGPSELVRYITLLATHIPDPQQRRRFEADAKACIRVS
ncbi:MAG TPA: hypothetical protein VK138_04450 [Acidiferrobacterales bacterium]|nr:hypothetical protein [Acidiferrobacterales bacterium]